MEKTRIEWCDSSWNPISGCYHTCPYCYARATANRFKGCDIAESGETDADTVYLQKRLKVTNKDGVTRNAAYPFGFTPTFHEYRLDDPKTKGFGKTTSSVRWLICLAVGCLTSGSRRCLMPARMHPDTDICS